MANAGDGTERGSRTTAIALALAMAAVLASWIPWLGLGLGAAALGLAFWARRAGRRTGGLPEGTRIRSRRALGVGAFGFLLGLGFTVAFRACAPSQETPAEEKSWEEFEKSFEVPAPPDGK